MSGNPSTNGVHKVRSGETLSGIAQKHNVTLSELLSANPEITDPGLIRVGQTIKIPARAAAAPQPAAATVAPAAVSAPAPAQPVTTPSTAPATAAAAPAADPNAILAQYAPTGASDRTARQDRLPQRGITGVRASEEMAKADRARVMRHKEKFIAAGRLFGLPPALLAAIASRESRGGAVLVNGFGDGGHGFGLMQVDDRNPFPVVRDGGPAGQPHINQATKILRDKLDAVRRTMGSLTPAQQLQAAVSRYNGGRGLPPPDSDRGTTGGDYMNDVWARAQFYARVEDWSAA